MTDCRKISTELGCYTDTSGAQQSVIIHNVVDKDGVVIATYYLDPAGVPVDTTGGTVTAGACPVAVVLVPGSLDVTGTAVVTPPVSPVRSLTVTREAGLVEFSTNGGATWVRMNVNGSRTWSAPVPGQTVDVSNLRFRGLTATSNYDLIWEV